MTCARSSRIEKKVTRTGRLRALLLSFILSVTKIPVVVDLAYAATRSASRQLRWETTHLDDA